MTYADMKLFYINDELATGDGSNSHAVGMLRSLEKILGRENVGSFPRAEDGSAKPVNLKAGRLRVKFRGPLQVARYFRKKALSVKRSRAIVAGLRSRGFAPTHVLARSTVFDTTAVRVAKAFRAKLVYEINTPMYYECGVIHREPMTAAIEKWEKRILEASDRVYIVSAVCRDMLCARYSLSREKFLVVPNGYMGELYTETEGEKREIRNEIRAAEGLDGKFVVTFVGSLKTWHGIRNFCQTAERMEKDESVRFLVLGDGEMHDMIADYASAHGNMIFKGKVGLDAMKRYLYASDLGVMPYEKKENFYYSPLKMFDMIGAGLPFVGTGVGQIEELCSAYGLQEDFLADSNDPAEIGRKIGRAEGKIDDMKDALARIRQDATWEARAGLLLSSLLS